MGNVEEVPPEEVPNYIGADLEETPFGIKRFFSSYGMCPECEEQRLSLHPEEPVYKVLCMSCGAEVDKDDIIEVARDDPALRNIPPDPRYWDFENSEPTDDFEPDPPPEAQQNGPEMADTEQTEEPDSENGETDEQADAPESAGTTSGPVAASEVPDDESDEKSMEEAKKDANSAMSGILIAGGILVCFTIIGIPVGAVMIYLGIQMSPED